MNISLEDLRRLIFDEDKSIGEIAKIYGITIYELKKFMRYNPSLSRVKKHKSNAWESKPPETGGGMSFELTKD